MELKTINDVDVRQLEHRMRHADWTHDYSSDLAIRNNGYTEVQYLKTLLETLSKDEDGKKIASTLWDKYVPSNTYTKPQYLGGYTDEPQFLNKLQGQEISEGQLNAIKQQFATAGFKEAFTPQAIEQIKRGAPEYRLPYDNDNQGDLVKSTLFLKRSASTLDYYFNKASISVTKEGEKQAVSQTFYFTDKNKLAGHQNDVRYKQANKFTLKKAANYLAGRPVLNWWLDKNNNLYQAWVRINFKSTLNNGDYEMKRFTKEYPFDLKSMLQNYAIKELANNNYADRLNESLERGNLQKVTFVDKQGKEESLYVSPNIGLVKGGSLNVYALDKSTKISVEAMVEKGYIGKELAQSINERMANFQKERGNTVAKKTTVSQNSDENRHRHTIKK